MRNHTFRDHDGSPLRAVERRSVKSYQQLVTEIAQLATANRDQIFLYRGQSVDYHNRDGSSSLFPTIYRGDPLYKTELQARFQALDAATADLQRERSLSQALRSGGRLERKFSRWAILQHYNVCPTPFLDISHSLHVACSFASLNNKAGNGFVYVLGFPYPHGSVSLFADEDLVSVRLLSVTPHQAKRPHFQEGYVAATLDVEVEYDDKSELDFGRRLVAVFELALDDREFWGAGFGPIPESLLFPDDNDEVLLALETATDTAKRMARPGEVGQFIALWSQFEQQLRDSQSGSTRSVASAASVIQSLSSGGRLDKSTTKEIDALRKLRNRVVHSPGAVTQKEVVDGLSRLKQVIRSWDFSGPSTYHT